jgi:plasmid stability protein
MAQLIVRDLDADLVLALKQRAARHGRSAEAEHRLILSEALAPDVERPAFKDFLLAMPDVLEDRDLAPLRDLPRGVPW